MIQIYGGGSVANWFHGLIKWLFAHKQTKTNPKHTEKRMPCPSKYPPSRNIVHMVKSNRTERILVMTHNLLLVMIQIYGGGSVANWFHGLIKWLLKKHTEKRMPCPSKYPPSRNIVHMVKSNRTERILVMTISGNTNDIWNDIWQYPPPGQVSSPPAWTLTLLHYDDHDSTNKYILMIIVITCWNWQLVLCLCS